MVAANERYSVWVSDFEAQQEEERFERVEAAVDEVTCKVVSRGVLDGVNWYVHTHEKVVRVWDVSSDAKQFHKIVELSVDVTAYLLKQCDQPCP